MYFQLFISRSWLPIVVLCTVLGEAHAQDIAAQSAETDGLDSDYTFDASLFRGNTMDKETLARFNHVAAVPPGTYKVDLFVNNTFVEQLNIRFVDDKNGGVQPCLTPELLSRANIVGNDPIKSNAVGNSNVMGSQTYMQSPSANQSNTCLFLGKVATGSSSHFDLGRLRLDLSVPQVMMRRVPRDYVAESELDAGGSIGFVNYLTNYYHTENLTNGVNSQSQNSAYASFQGGINLGEWQYRQQSSLNYTADEGAKWMNQRSYVQRPIYAIQSELTLGQLYTTGQFFPGLQYDGANLATDERMRPNSMQGYAPIIRGAALTNAKVTVLQNGTQIYQTTVAAGPFEIDDLYPTNFYGDLNVVVMEADGSTHSFTVPFAALPMSLRAGFSKYNLSLGKTNNTGNNSVFAEGTYQYGLSNNVTMDSGVRVAQGYQALLLGGVYGSDLGAFGTDMTYSKANLSDGTTPNRNVTGWMADLTYSKTFQPTKTTIGIAGYQYSTSGFWNLNDVLNERQATQAGQQLISDTYMQHYRVQLTLNQSLGKFGTFYFTGSSQNYYQGRRPDTTVQVSYNKTFGIVNVNLSYSRQRLGANPMTGASSTTVGQFNNMGGLTLSIPLDFGHHRTPYTPNLNIYDTYNNSLHTNQYQVGLNGALDENSSLTYDVGVTGAGSASDQTVWSGDLYKRLSFMNIGVSASHSDQYWQTSATATGALAIHSGGITLGSYLGDTFALVEAKGAEGAKVSSSPYSVIDPFGYALIPSMNPYRYNMVTLDPQGMSNDIELEGGEQRVAPYAGAAVKVKFKTREGHTVLIRSTLDDGLLIPMGADVLDETGANIGMVGQGGQVYARTPKTQGVLTVRWGDDRGEYCHLSYLIDNHQLKQPLIKLQAQCTVEK